MTIQYHQGSLILAPNRKCVGLCEFILDLNSNLSPILLRFREIRAFRPLFHTLGHSLFWPKFSGVPFGVESMMLRSAEFKHPRPETEPDLWVSNLAPGRVTA